jgi:hypothetical protein
VAQGFTSIVALAQAVQDRTAAVTTAMSLGLLA